MKLTDLMPIEDWENLEKEIHDRFGLNAAVFDETGARITKYANWANSLCPAIKADPKGLSQICAVANQHAVSQMRQSGRAYVGECDAGLVKICVPVFVGREYIGAVSGCGHALDTGDGTDAFLVHMTTGMPEDKANELARSVKQIKQDEVESLVQFINSRLGEIVSRFQEKSRAVGGEM